MADQTKFQLPGTRRRPICALHNNFHSLTVMLLFFIYFLNRKRAFRWSPAVDLSDPYIAAALAPMSHS